MAEFWTSLKDFFVAAETRWQAILIGVAVAVLFGLLSKYISKIISNLVNKIFGKWPKTAKDLAEALKNPFRVFLIALGIEIAFLIISPGTEWMNVINKLFRMTNITLLAWALLNYTPAATRLIIKYNEENGQSSEVAIRFMAILLKIVIISLLAAILISELGYNINGIIAGLGLSGLTLSLAAQNTASNLFSGFEIITDKPFDVGDYIACGTNEGFVEDITMRSTRMRTRDDLLITIPNATLMKEPITNYSKMGKRVVRFTIGLTYDATTEQIQKVIADLTSYLQTSDDVDNTGVSVTFKDFGGSSQDIEVAYFTKTTDKLENLKVREQVNYEIRRIVADAGADFAFPSTTVYLSGDSSK